MLCHFISSNCTICTCPRRPFLIIPHLTVTAPACADSTARASSMPGDADKGTAAGPFKNQPWVLCRAMCLFVPDAIYYWFITTIICPKHSKTLKPMEPLKRAAQQNVTKELLLTSVAATCGSVKCLIRCGSKWRPKARCWPSLDSRQRAA